jgi:hypothetical protein
MKSAACDIWTIRKRKENINRLGAPRGIKTMLYYSSSGSLLVLLYCSLVTHYKPVGYTDGIRVFLADDYCRIVGSKREERSHAENDEG